MKKIKLLGDLAAFKADWELNVSTPGEALRAIEANRPGFLAACDQGDYVAILVDADNPDLTRQIILDTAEMPWADEVLMIMPRMGGDIPVAAIVAAYAAVGVATVATSALVVITSVVLSIGLSLAMSAIANLITGSKKSASAVATESYESKPSFISNGAVNVVRAGHPYPIIAGNFLCGSIVLSSQIHVKDIPI
jgi:predicted phage tail protein